MPISLALQTERRAAGLCPRDGVPCAPFRYCAVCRATRARHRAKLDARRARAGACLVPGCDGLPRCGAVRCPGCLEVDRIKATARQAARRAEGVCIEGGCRRATVDGYSRCKMCRARRRAKERAR